VNGVCEDIGKDEKEEEEKMRRKRRIMRKKVMKNLMVGDSVVSGIEWKWREKDGKNKGEGNVNGEINNGWIDVKWDNGG
jgi:E3 ubiquitin-protein ligase HECTD1